MSAPHHQVCWKQMAGWNSFHLFHTNVGNFLPLHRAMGVGASSLPPWESRFTPKVKADDTDCWGCAVQQAPVNEPLRVRQLHKNSLPHRTLHSITTKRQILKPLCQRWVGRAPAGSCFLFWSVGAGLRHLHHPPTRAEGCWANSTALPGFQCLGHCRERKHHTHTGPYCNERRSFFYPGEGLLQLVSVRRTQAPQLPSTPVCGCRSRSRPKARRVRAEARSWARCRRPDAPHGHFQRTPLSTVTRCASSPRRGPEVRDPKRGPGWRTAIRPAGRAARLSGAAFPRGGLRHQPAAPPPPRWQARPPAPPGPRLTAPGPPPPSRPLDEARSGGELGRARPSVCLTRDGGELLD